VRFQALSAYPIGMRARPRRPLANAGSVRSCQPPSGCTEGHLPVRYQVAQPPNFCDEQGDVITRMGDEVELLVADAITRISGYVEVALACDASSLSDEGFSARPVSAFDPGPPGTGVAALDRDSIASSSSSESGLTRRESSRFPTPGVSRRRLGMALPTGCHVLNRDAASRQLLFVLLPRSRGPRGPYWRASSNACSAMACLLWV
jgi:hypothetical protein